MKKLIMTFILILSAGIACAQIEDVSDEEYRNMQQLSKKLIRMKKEMDRFMGDIMSTYPLPANVEAESFGRDVRVDISENSREFIVRADLPGMEKDKIGVALENNRMLTISGQREVMKNQTSPGMVRQERMAGSFKRMLELPSECRSDGIKASYANGVLEIVIPKKEEKRQESVKIEVL